MTAGRSVGDVRSGGRIGGRIHGGRCSGVASWGSSGVAGAFLVGWIPHFGCVIIRSSQYLGLRQPPEYVCSSARHGWTSCSTFVAGSEVGGDVTGPRGVDLWYGDGLGLLRRQNRGGPRGAASRDDSAGSASSIGGWGGGAASRDDAAGSASSPGWNCSRSVTVWSSRHPSETAKVVPFCSGGFPV